MHSDAQAPFEVSGSDDARARWLVVCEHASNAFPARWGDLGLDAPARVAHIAWDPGALGVARALAGRLAAPLVAARVSRLVYDLNRPPDAPSAMAEKSEVWDIPGNRGLSDAARLDRTAAIYLPFHDAVRERIARAMAHGMRPVLVTVHSFTPVWFGTPRAVELGIINDDDPALAAAAVAAARRLTDLKVAQNEPYSAADAVTHTLRIHGTAYGLANVMLEIRNDLIATEDAQEAMAERLAAVLVDAMAGLSQDGRVA